MSGETEGKILFLKSYKILFFRNTFSSGTYQKLF